MKTLLTFCLAASGCVLVYWSVQAARSELAEASVLACGCADAADLSARLKAVNAVIDVLNPLVNGPGSGDPLTPTSERDLSAKISRALDGSGSGRLGALNAVIDQSSCAITPSPGVSACIMGAVTAHFENQREACISWRGSGNGKTFRVGYSYGDAASEELTSYDNERAFLEEQLSQLQSEKCQRTSTRNPTSSPTSPAAGRTMTPGTTAGGPTSGPTTTAGSNVPPIQITFQPRHGAVQYILDGTATFPALGVFKYVSNSTIPFEVDRAGRVTGGGTVLTEFLPPSNCSVEGYNGVSELSVTGRLVGDVIEATFASRNGSQPDVQSVKLTCKVGGQEGFALNYPVRHQAFTGTQRLKLPAPGQPFSTTEAGMNPNVLNAMMSSEEYMNSSAGFIYKVTLRTYYTR